VQNTASDQYSVGVKVTAGYDAGAVSAKLSVAGNWSWTTTNEGKASATASKSASLSLTGPSYGYAGPTDMAVYWDSLYSSFVFAPAGANGSDSINGTITNSAGQPAAHVEVDLLVAGKTHRTFTDRRGLYRFYGLPHGTGVLESRGMKQTVRIGPSKVPADMRLHVR
jgi:hypothetical protein